MPTAVMGEMEVFQIGLMVFRIIMAVEEEEEEEE